MRRILVSCAVVGVLALPAAATARASEAAGGRATSSSARRWVTAASTGRPSSRSSCRASCSAASRRKAEVQIVQLPSVSGRGAPQVTVRTCPRNHSGARTRPQGPSARSTAAATSAFVRWAGCTGWWYAARACISSPAGTGTSRSRAPRLLQHADGTYSVNGGRSRSLPKRPVNAENRRRMTAVAGDGQTILVVEDEQAIASFVAAYLRKDGFTVRDDRERSRGAGHRRRRRSVARHPRPDAPRPRRDRGLPADPRDEHAARADADGARRRPRQDRGPRGRRRRLPHEALQSARARGEGARDPPPQRRKDEAATAA